MLKYITQKWTETNSGVFLIDSEGKIEPSQLQTNAAFSDKWGTYARAGDSEKEKLFASQRHWFLSLYGYTNEEELRKALQDKEVIVDAGCGLGYKSAWFASLAPQALIIAIDYSDAIFEAQKRYGSQYPNIIFAKGDIAKTLLPEGLTDFTVCDQVIMHTECPQKTLDELARITKQEGNILCYWYRKKALPRELLDDHFRTAVSELSVDELWELSKSVTELGRLLSNLNIDIEVPDIPALGITGGKMDIQRFIYWNFLKCYWNEDLGYSTSLITNFDWYSPKNASRYTKLEVLSQVSKSKLKEVFFHEEEACFSGRFIKA